VARKGHKAAEIDMNCNQCGKSEAHLLFVKGGYNLVRCAGCGLAYIDNPPTPERLSEIYSASANYHDELHDPQSAAFARMSGVAQRHLDIVRKRSSGGRLLDVGCSTGLFLDKAHQAGFDGTGVEFSAESAGFARAQFGLSVTTGSIHDITNVRDSFDIVTMFDVIEHVPDPIADMRVAYDLLKPGGLFILSTPNIDGLFPRLSYPLAKMLAYWPHPEPPHHLYQFSVRTLGGMLRKSGFAVGEVDHLNIDLSYSFGTLRTFMESPKILAYALIFAPIAKIGPLFRSGDWFYMTARKL
jgi:2-polyprenyl-3-methyl-5-hydroxy-6-metoxy-1,4-benzoquinol methylase